jgi:hypothetical protein
VSRDLPKMMSVGADGFISFWGMHPRHVWILHRWGGPSIISSDRLGAEYHLFGQRYSEKDYWEQIAAWESDENRNTLKFMSEKF